MIGRLKLVTLCLIGVKKQKKPKKNNKTALTVSEETVFTCKVIHSEKPIEKKEVTGSLKCFTERFASCADSDWAT